MDPAVVAAHPMPKSQSSLVRPPSKQTPDSSSHTKPGFGSSYSDQQSAFVEQSLNTVNVSSVDQNVHSQGKQQQKSSQDYTNTGYSQSKLSHLQSDSLFPGGSDSGYGKGSSESGPISHTQFDIPPQIPMPPGHDQSNSQVRE